MFQKEFRKKMPKVLSNAFYDELMFIIIPIRDLETITGSLTDNHSCTEFLEASEPLAHPASFPNIQLRPCLCFGFRCSFCCCQELHDRILLLFRSQLRFIQAKKCRRNARIKRKTKEEIMVNLVLWSDDADDEMATMQQYISQDNNIRCIKPWEDGENFLQWGHEMKQKINNNTKSMGKRHMCMVQNDKKT
ncbi:hypothetical protein HELRODRAFT_160384 [Helobdella robusta]|uniref:Uncharacterized protein n=1 Tax=Helobdella robusta TaxID=6412 RepID=T1EQ66_HELRO|nr:hypothetical protein HELRODRAFT_160384 [Helobdella robusta]ESO06226.1 hypothetical protein HELRODRAFT_160384 [Helobdella robusta]